MARLLHGVAVSALFAGAQGFVPFADVDELKPQSLHKYCGPITPGQKPEGKLRWCKHAFNKTLEDEGTIRLDWEMHVDPDTILNLDTEAQHGVKLIRCEPDELQLELPESHAMHAAEGQIIVGSRFLHNCKHLDEKHLYHKVSSIRQHQWQDTAAGKRAIVVLHTEELGSWAKAVPFFHFYFEYMPIEAREKTVEFPEMRTDYGLNRAYLAAKKAKASGNATHRQLGFFSTLMNVAKKEVQNIENMDGASMKTGGFQSGGHKNGGIETENSLFNLMPKQMSNFGWNWDFFLNEEQEPKYDITGPGTKGEIVLKKPYIKVHSGIFLNHTSKFNGFAMPHVQWRFGMAGHGSIKGRVESELDTTGTAGFDPIESGQEHNLPFLSDLERFEKPVWFRKMDIAAGGMPISMEPGFQLTGTLYHSGVFKGSLAFGGKTRGHLTPILHYDSLLGFQTTCTGELYDTDVTPPLWMVFTKQFEIGVQLKPTILMRGDFASFIENGVMAIEVRPYMNITVTREAAHGWVNYSSDLGAVGQPGQKPLTMYPFRVMGLDNMDFHRRYIVEITGNGKTIRTKPEINWGHVNYHGQLQNFDMGFMSQESVTSSKFAVTLFEVDDSTGRAVQSVLGTGEVVCKSMLNGVCEPSPNMASIKNTMGTEVAEVQLAIDWDDMPEPWFATKIKGLSFSFPSIMIREDELQKAFPGSSGTRVLHLIQGGKTFVCNLKGNKEVVMSTMAGDTIIEFGPSFIQAWEPCNQDPLCDAPMIELWEGFLKIAEASLPRIEWNSATAMQGTREGFLGAGVKDMKVPLTIAMQKPGDSTVTVAVAKLTATIVPPTKSALFMSPITAASVVIGASLPFKWTIADVDTEQIYKFRLEAMRLAPSGNQADPQYRKVNDKMLVPVSGSEQVVESKCKVADLNAMAQGSAPCAFEHLFPFKSPTFQMGEQIVVLVEWEELDSMQHVMYSPPFEVAGSVRRLAALPEEASPRKLTWKNGDWKDRAGLDHEACKERDLHFKVGEGILFRGSIQSMGMPKGFPMLAGGSNGPEVATAWRRVGGPPHNRTDRDLMKMMPHAFCEAGICNGALPGCTKDTAKDMFFPKIVINMDRTITWDELEKDGGVLPFHFLSKSIKPALCYAFAAMPEMIELGMKENKEFNRQKSELAQRLQATQAQPPVSKWWAPSSANTAPEGGGFWNGQQAPAAPAPAGLNNWWNSNGATAQRRLADLRAKAANPVGSWEKVPEVHELQDNQVRMTFKEGVPFIIDRPLIEMMLQHGYFQELYDDKGPLTITGFHVDSGIVVGQHTAAAVAPEPLNFAVWGALFAVALTAAGLAVALRPKRLELELAAAE